MTDKRIKRRQKERLKKQRRLTFISVAVTAFLVLMTFVVFNQRRLIQSIKNEYEIKIEEQSTLLERVKHLEEEIKQVNDLDYIEKRAREELGMVYEDDVIYIENQGQISNGQGDQDQP